MTLSMAWVRDVGGVRELVVASDSRLRAPFVWDCCPKILPLPRNDCVLCFAGPTHLAYPIMLQIQSAVRLHPRALSRAQDLFDFKGKVLEIINGMRLAMHQLPSDPAENGESDAYFLLAGYSWRRAEFVIWTLHFDASIDKFTFRPATPWAGITGYRLTAIVGDCVLEAKQRLSALLKSVGKLEAGGLDMEPLSVLRDVIREGKHESVGGAPQIVKVYRHMNATPFGTFWPAKTGGRVTVLGRPLLSYEQVDLGVYDVDTGDIIYSPPSEISEGLS